MNKADLRQYLLNKTYEYAKGNEILLYAAEPLPAPKNRYQGLKQPNLREEAYQQYLDEIGVNKP
ncbi:hypothetical protein [Pseudomonas sp. PLMAX]|jgi:hypothetical protein|uniref:hypothetical protein n=1 Tax=Pseudomonas sp. PLMAX TaxID=2201998 RepID=UPI0038B9083E